MTSTVTPTLSAVLGLAKVDGQVPVAFDTRLDPR